jgi:NAD(P)-dependent dehydrogenase (short-subunit alcohol dehydrogenase family)
MWGVLVVQPMRLEDQTVLVTGAAGGLGSAISVACAAEGAHVIATDLDAAGVAATVADAEEAGGSAEGHELDVTDGAAVHAVVDAVAEEHGLDGIVNNAGIAHALAYTEDLDDTALERVIDVNLKGVWHGCHAALPHMKAQGSGAIVNVSSLAGTIGLPKQAIYSLTKGAVLNFTRAVAGEAGPKGVRANAVCPGVVDTEMGRQFFEDAADPSAVRERMEAMYPLRRLGEPEDIAAPVVFLLSEEASWLTGHGLVVDGGYSAV